VNGHCLGRFWNIGPSQTAYLPGPWLKEQNEIVILDLFGPEEPVVNALDKPVLNELRPELDFARVRRPSVQLGLDGAQPAKEGEFAAGSGTQEIRFSPVKGRFFCLESLNAFDGKPFAAVAELDLMGEDGKVLSHEGWTVAYVDSEERSAEDGTAENAIDGQTVNFWHTDWSGAKPAHPHRLVLDLGRSQTLSGFRYVPRQGEGPVGGRIKGYRVFVGDDLVRR
jgi:beta-galactosidase